MPRVIHKYTLVPGQDTRLSLPADSDIIHVANQHGLLTMWIDHDLSLKSATRTFTLVGTGHPITSDLIYMGTAHCDPFVWHVYERVLEV
jgi:hypothetical protein